MENTIIDKLKKPISKWKFEMLFDVRIYLFVIFWISMFHGFLNDYFGISAIKYVCDLLILISLFFAFLNRKKLIGKKQINDTKPVLILLAIFTIEIIISWIANKFVLLHALWGFRNYYRFFAYFFLCYLHFSKDDYERIMSWLIYFFPVNTLIMVYQFFVEHLTYDYFGGVFGKVEGCHSGLMIYYGLVTIILLFRYEKDKTNIYKMILYFLIMSITAAIGELRAYFPFLLVITAVSIVFIKNAKKIIFVILLSVASYYLGTILLVKIFPNYDQYFTANGLLSDILNTNQAYSSREGLDVGRSSIFNKLGPILDAWGNKYTRWIGLGLGNGDYSGGFSFLNSDFYNKYHELHYVFFSLGFLFVELGYIGTVTYIMFYVVLGIEALKKWKKSYYLSFSVMIILFCTLLIYYNCSLRTNYAYIMFSLLPITLYRDSE